MKLESEHPQRMLVSKSCNLTIRHSFRLSCCVLSLFALKRSICLQPARFAAKPRSFPRAMCRGKICFIAILALALHAAEAARTGLETSAALTAWPRKCQDIKKTLSPESVGTSECREVLLWCYRSLSIPRLWGI